MSDSSSPDIVRRSKDLHNNKSNKDIPTLERYSSDESNK